MTDAYAANLSVQSFTFIGNGSTPLGVLSQQSFSVKVTGLRGAEAVAAAVNISALTLPTGLTVTSDNHLTAPTLTFTATTSLTVTTLAAVGNMVTLPVVLDGGKVTLNRAISLQIAPTGIGVDELVTQYYLSTSDSTQTGGSWSATPAPYAAGHYYWKREKVDWTDGQTTYTDPVLDNALNSIGIGGRNLIIHTLNPDVSAAKNYPKLRGQTTNTAGRGTATAVEHGIRFDSTQARWPYIRFGNATVSNLDMLGLEAGETYTLSCDAKFKAFSGSPDSTADYVFGVFLYTLNEGASSSGFRACVPAYTYKASDRSDRGVTQTARVEATITIPATAKKIYIDLRAGKAGGSTNDSDHAIGDFVEAKNLKMEKGTRATDWTPAPEDFEAELTTLQESLEAQIDGKIETWSQDTDPSANWTAAEKEAHNGDLWFYTGTAAITVNGISVLPSCTYQYTYSNSVGTWARYDAQSTSLFDVANGKSTIYYGTTSGTYSGVKTGDYLVDSTDGCTYRWSGSAWVKETDYKSAVDEVENVIVIGGRNLATVNENDPDSMQTEYANGATAISNGYIVKANNSKDYLMLNSKRTASPFSTGDELYFEFIAHASQELTTQFEVYAYTSVPANISALHSVSDPIVIGTTDSKITGSVKLVTSDNSKQWETDAVSYFICLHTGTANKDVYVKKANVRRKYAGHLLVDGSITADKLSANAITAEMISGKDITGGTFRTTLGDSLYFQIENTVNGAEVDPYTPADPEQVYSKLQAQGLFNLIISNDTEVNRSKLVPCIFSAGAFYPRPSEFTGDKKYGWFADHFIYAERFYSEAGKLISLEETRAYRGMNASAIGVPGLSAVINDAVGIVVLRFETFSFLAGTGTDTAAYHLPTALYPVDNLDLVSTHNGVRFRITAEGYIQPYTAVPSSGNTAIRGSFTYIAFEGF